MNKTRSRRQQQQKDAAEVNETPTTTTRHQQQQLRRDADGDNMTIIDKRLTQLYSILTFRKKKNRGWIVAIPYQSLFVVNYLNYEINLVSVLVVSCQILKIVNCFVCCKNFVLENKMNEHIQYLWKTKRPVLIFISPLHHSTIHYLSIALLVSIN